ncbi:MAG TPA: hypothetical protein VGD56_17570 [Gemmatirosa sp.]
MIARIQDALAPLHGKRLWDAGRAANMLWLQFGDRSPAPTDRDRDRIAGEYALHVQCPWRLSHVAGVVVGASDVFVPADPDVAEDAFRSDRRGASTADAHLRRWLTAHAAAPLPIERIHVDRCCGVALYLEQEFALEIFPDASSEPHDLREQWRLLRPGNDAEHLVVLNHGIE